jgi:hypothetical protein
MQWHEDISACILGGWCIDVRVMCIMFSTRSYTHLSLSLVTQKTLKTCQHICGSHSKSFSSQSLKLKKCIPRGECPFSCDVHCIHHSKMAAPRCVSLTTQRNLSHLWNRPVIMLILVCGVQVLWCRCVDVTSFWDSALPTLLWHVHMLLGTDCETSNYPTAIAE